MRINYTFVLILLERGFVCKLLIGRWFQDIPLKELVNWRICLIKGVSSSELPCGKLGFEFTEEFQEWMQKSQRWAIWSGDWGWGVGTPANFYLRSVLGGEEHKQKEPSGKDKPCEIHRLLVKCQGLRWHRVICIIYTHNFYVFDLTLRFRILQIKTLASRTLYFEHVMPWICIMAETIKDTEEL